MGLLQLLVLGTTILATLTSAQLLQDVSDPLYSSGYNFSPKQIEDQKGDQGFYDDNDFDSSELIELLLNEPDSNDYELELDNLIDSINSAEEDVEEEEEDHFLDLLNILEDLEDPKEFGNFEDPVDPEDECDNTQCNREIIQPPNLDEEIENGKRQKRSPSPGIRSSSSSRSSSSRPSSSSSSRSSSSRGSSSSSRGSSSSSRGSSSSSRGSTSSSRGSSSSRGGWFTRRSSSSGSSRSRGSSSGSRAGSSSGSSSSGSRYGSSSSKGSRYGTSSTSTGSSSSSGSSSGTSSSGSTSVRQPVGPSTGTAVVAGAGTGAAIGATSGSSSTGSKPVQPSGGYPTGTQPASGYPTGTQPAGGYPSGTSPSGGYPTGTQPAGGYPTGTQPAGGYPTGTQPAGGYPSGTKPSGGYPTGTQPAGGYPTGTQPAGGYPTGTQPASGYPTGTQPAGGYPTGTQPAGGYPTGTQPAGGYPTGTQPAGGYPSGTSPSGGYPTGTQPAGGYPTGTQPAGGYPSGTRPIGGYPTGTQPAGGYPTGTQPAGGYPSGTIPSGGYPIGTQPAGGYPTGTQPAGGYPSGTRPIGGYPTGTHPAGGYPTGTQPVGGYPTGTRPVGVYPTGTQPAGGYPGYPSGSVPFGSSNQPYGGYPTGHQPYGGGYSGHQPYGGGYSGHQPYGGYPTSSHAYGGHSRGGFSRGGLAAGGLGLAAGGLAVGGLAAGGLAHGGFGGAGGYPVGGYPMPERKKTKKEKVKGLLVAAGTAYAIRKAHKKSKLLSPFGHRGYGGGGFGGGGLAAAGLGMAAGKTAKKILGAYVKIQIAKYALKFGAKAAKAYFEYKLGRELDEYMIGKFVHRYHQHRVRGSSRWRHRTHYDKSSSKEVTENITLGEFCHRPCNESEKLVCQFSIEVHLYQTLSRACYNCPSNITDCERPECLTADGSRRMVVAVNKAIPGPSIQVCAGDKVLVDVLNNLPSTSVTLHWHGLTLGPTPAVPKARATPFMDGTPGVTQCPIPPGSGFRYSFDATDPGTHFWHAQTGLERGDGVFGPLIIHQTMAKDPMLILAEHMFVVNDWFHASTQLKYVMKQNSGQEAKPKSILINGQGREKHDDSGTQVPYYNFIVEKNMRYRLRIINAAITNCPVTIAIDSHDLILLAADGSSINPVNTSTVLVHPGERYDAMFSAEQESGDDGAIFWIRVDGGNECQGLAQYASLQYLPTNISAGPLPTVPANSNPSATPSTTPGTKVFTGSCETPGQRCVSGLRSPTSLPESVKATRAAYTFYLAFSKRNIHNENFYSLLFYDINDDVADKKVPTPQINNLSFRGTSTPLLVNQRPFKSENCSSEGVRRGQCTEDFCECLHALQVPVGAIVDFVLIDEGNGAGTSQPVHLHGYKFWVLAHVEAASVPELIIPESENITLPEGISREKIIRLDEEGKLERYLRTPAIKDTIAIPVGGYAITRIAAENKGFWVLESQVLFDSQAGMSLVLQVGTAGDLPKAPKDFPTC